MMIVTKCLCADRTVCEMIAKHPRVDFLADSRVMNIRKYADLMARTASRACCSACL